MVLFLTLSAMTYSIVHVATEYLHADRRLSHNTKYTFYRLQNLLQQLILQVIRIGLTLTQAFLRIFLKKLYLRKDIFQSDQKEKEGYLFRLTTILPSLDPVVAYSNMYIQYIRQNGNCLLQSAFCGFDTTLNHSCFEFTSSIYSGFSETT